MIATVCADDFVIVQPVDLERAFLADAELVRIACSLGDARRLVMGAAIPRNHRRELRAIADRLDRLLHGGPYLRARSRRPA